MRRALVVSLALLPALAGADQVFTRGGGTLDGEIIERGPDSIVVDIGGGTIGLPLSYVERIVPGRSPVGQYRDRASRLAPDDAAGWVALGLWSRQHELRSQAKEAFQYALSIDPGNALAHQALGHVQVGGEWMTRDEGYRARGLVRHDGQWMTPGERDALVAERQALLAVQRAEAEDLARLRESEARAAEAEARARIVQAKARIAEEAADRVEALPLGMQWLPLAGGLPGVLTPSFGAFGSPASYRAAAGGCHLRGRIATGPALVHVPGRGGALLVSGDPRPLVRR